MPKLTIEILDEISHSIEGTCDGLEKYIDRYDLDIDEEELESELSMNVERCKGCGWWMEICMLDGMYQGYDEEPPDYNEEEHVGYCWDCIKDRL
jgi:ferredoxin